MRTLLGSLGRAFWSASRRLLVALAVVLIALTAAWYTFKYFNQPTPLRIAVGPDGGSDSRVISALERILESHRTSIRLQPVTTTGFEKNYELLEKGDVDLGILRADQGLPGDAMVVMILRKNVVVIVAPSKLELETLTQLKGKRLGIVARSSLDEAAFGKLLAFHGMQPSDVKATVIKPDQVAALTDSGRLDAIAVFGPIVDPEVSAVVYAVDRKKKSGPSILAIDLAALADENTMAATSVTIPKNAFARRKTPDDEVDTIAVPTIIAGTKATGPLRQRLRTQAIEELARNLIERRVELSQKLGTIVAIEAPDNEKGARMPVHPGTAAYLDSTDTSWYTLFSDQIWTVWLIGGALASLGAALFGYLRPPRDDAAQAILNRLQAITRRAKERPDKAELDAMTDDLADLAVDLSALAYAQRIDQLAFDAIELALDNARFAIEKARGALRASASAA